MQKLDIVEMIAHAKLHKEIGTSDLMEILFREKLRVNTTFRFN